MSTDASNDLKERARINANLDRFLRLATWTPAMAAMLVSGLTPLPGSSEIPEEAPSLRDPGIAAKARYLAEARKVLERWIDAQEDYVESGLSTEIPSTIDPIDFLQWAEEEYDQTPDSMKPTWLRYWLAFAGFEQYSDAPPPAPLELVRYGSKLDAFAEIVATKTGSERQRPQLTSADHEYVERMSASIAAGHLAIGSLIISALQRADKPRTPKSVWTQLVAIVRETPSPDLRYVDEETLERPSGRTWTPYTRDALTAYLTRHRKALGFE